MRRDVRLLVEKPRAGQVESKIDLALRALPASCPPPGQQRRPAAIHVRADMAARRRERDERAMVTESRIDPSRLARGALVATIAGVLLLAPGSVGAQALHCGRTLVVPGDSDRDVLRKCGEPTRRQGLSKGGAPRGSRVRSPSARRRPSRRKRSGSHGREVWIYDLGSRQLVRFLTFERGRLVAIEFGGYGR
jgi:Protein of unknown function (DUF2845)